MAFYYEAEAPVWKYKERYADWKLYPKRVGNKLEKLWKKIHQDGDTSVVEYDWKQDESISHKINLQTMTSQNANSYYRASEVSREGYPYPNPGNTKKLKKLHGKHMATEEEGGETFNFFNLATFFEECGIDPNGLESLIILAMCEVDTFMDVSEKKFVGGLSKCGCSDPNGIVQAVKPIKRTLVQEKKVKVLKSFARWLFIAAKDDSARTISTATLAGLLSIMCPQSNFPLSATFVSFLTAESENEEGDRKTCSKDDWVMIVEFVAQKNSWDGFDDYVEDEGWPLIVSECYESGTKKAEN